LGRKQFAFRQSEYEVQKYLPYFNGGRVLAIRGSVVLSFPKEGDAVPLYLQPTLGGSDELRGFVSYRFRDYHSLSVSVEHRWHAFSFLDMSLFADAGRSSRSSASSTSRAFTTAAASAFACGCVRPSSADRLRGFVRRFPDDLDLQRHLRH
jgi:outer membrane protein assembly factor BamA